MGAKGDVTSRSSPAGCEWDVDPPCCRRRDGGFTRVPGVSYRWWPAVVEGSARRKSKLKLLRLRADQGARSSRASASVPHPQLHPGGVGVEFERRWRCGGPVPGLPRSAARRPGGPCRPSAHWTHLSKQTQSPPPLVRLVGGDGRANPGAGDVRRGRAHRVRPATAWPAKRKDAPCRRSNSPSRSTSHCVPPTTSGRSSSRSPISWTVWSASSSAPTP